MKNRSHERPWVFIVLTTLLGAAPSVGAFRGLASDHLGLKGHVIVEAGEAAEVAPPAGSKWENQVYSLNSRCFVLYGYYGFWGFGSKSAMLVVGKEEILKLVVLEPGIGGITADTHVASLVNCPDHAMIPPSCDGLSSGECSQLMDKHLKKLQKKLKELGGE
ncbi:MAG: hypothetical protein H6977_00675 [Gammaproteobacteria bacterium]|nr:hypothetical protein [Gammaproteobacteria bacterium]